MNICATRKLQQVLLKCPLANFSQPRAFYNQLRPLHIRPWALLAVICCLLLAPWAQAQEELLNKAEDLPLWIQMPDHARWASEGGESESSTARQGEQASAAQGSMKTLPDGTPIPSFSGRPSSAAASASSDNSSLDNSGRLLLAANPASVPSTNPNRTLANPSVASESAAESSGNSRPRYQGTPYGAIAPSNGSETVNSEASSNQLTTADDTASNSPSESDAICTYCTPDERLQLKLRRSRALASEMSSLLDEIEPLTDAGGMLQVLAGENGDAYSDTSKDLLLMIRDRNKPAPVVTPAPTLPTLPARSTSRPTISIPPKREQRVIAIFAQLADPERNVPTNAIIRVGRRDHVLRIGSTYRANGEEWTMRGIDETDDGLVVVVRNKQKKEVRLPWK